MFRRTEKTKRLMALAIVIMLLLNLAACSSKSMDSAAPTQDYAMNAESDSSAADAESAYEYDYGYVPERAESANSDSTKPSGSDGIDLSLNSGNVDISKKKIIRNAEFSLESKNFDKTVNDISDKADKLGGYLEYSSLKDGSVNQTNYDEVYGYYYGVSGRIMELRFRIPYQNFDSFLKSAKQDVTVLRENINTEDVSDSYFDMESRVRTLKIQLERLEGIMAESASLEEVLMLESEIATIRYEIEKLQGSVNRLDDSVRYSTVSISVYEWIEQTEVVEEKESFAERISAAFDASAETFVNFFQEFVIALVYIYPLLIIFVVAATIFYLIRKQRKNKRLRKKSEAETNKDEITETEDRHR